MAIYGGLPTTVAVLINAALIAYLALFPGIFALVMQRAFAGELSTGNACEELYIIAQGIPIIKENTQENLRDPFRIRAPDD